MSDKWFDRIMLGVIVLVALSIIGGLVATGVVANQNSARFAQDCAALGGVLLQTDVCVDENLKVILTR